MPDPDSLSDDDWADYVWLSNNTAGVVREWWCHSATNYWFIAERDTVSDEILKTYPASEVFTARRDFAPREEPGA
jgi:sarcosine oxidase subunit delta